MARGKMMKRLAIALAAMVVAAYGGIFVTNLSFGDSVPAIIGYPVVLKGDRAYTLGNTLVLPFASLRCEPGATLAAARDAAIYSFGTLEFVGEKERPITVSGQGGGGWGGIVIRFATGPSRFAHVRIKDCELAFKVRGASLQLEAVEMSGIAGVVRGKDSAISIDRSFIHTVADAGDVNVNVLSIAGGSLEMRNSFMQCPQKAQKIDNIDLHTCKKALIENNVLFGSKLENTDAIDAGDGSSGVMIRGNLIVGFSDKAVSVGQGSDCEIVGNVIVDCKYGIATGGSSATAIRNTFVDVSGGLRSRAGKLVSRGALFWNCGEIVIVAGPGAVVENTGSLANDKLPPGRDNQVGKFSFQDRDSWDFRLARTAQGAQGEVRYGADISFAGRKQEIEAFLAKSHAGG